jgi:ATP-dependent DNA helicase RecQ
LEIAGWLTLTESVFVPSSLHIKVNKEKLYDYQLRNKRLDVVIKAVLRNYQGVFNQYVNIREEQIAKTVKAKPVQIVNALNLMKKDNILDYQPQKEKPQIIYLKERIDISNLTIDQEQYNFLKRRQYHRVQSAIKYATTEKCRSQQLLAYFGELETPICGKCDVDLGTNQTELSKEEYRSFSKDIKMLLIQKPRPIQAIIAAFSSNKRKRVLTVVKFLSDNDYIVKKENNYHWKGKRK